MAASAAMAGEEADGAAPREAPAGVSGDDIRVRPFSVHEAPLPSRTRRPLDGLRLLLALLAVLAVTVVGVVAERTLQGLGRDLAVLGDLIPAGPVEVLSVATALVGLLLPPTLVVTLMIRGRLRATGEVLLAGVVAAVVAATVSLWLLRSAPDQLQQAVLPAGRTDASSPVPPYPALLVAVVSVVGWQDRPRMRRAAIFAVGGGLAVGLLEGVSTVAGTLVALGIGRAVGLAVRLVSGRPSVTPDGYAVGDALQADGTPVTAIRAVVGAEPRRYVVDTTDGPLDVRVLDRDREGAGWLGRTLRRLQLREEALPREAVTMRASLDRAVLLSLALDRAGARTPRLLRAVRLGPDAVLLVYEHVPGRTLRELDGELGEAALSDLWSQLRRLQRAQVAHRRISARALLVDEADRVWLLEPAGGEVAAQELALRLDLAHALVEVGLATGPDRAVTTAVEAMGAAEVARAVPLLQPVALSRGTRHALREHRDLLPRLRDGLVERAGTPPEEPVRLQRLTPLSLLTGLGAVVALYLVGTQLVAAPLDELPRDTDWRWLVVAVAAMAVTYVGAALALLGFVPERVPFGRAVAAQVALGFVRLIAPSTVGNATVNIRLLTRAGVPGALATASVAATQVGAVAVTLPLIAVLAVLTGSSASAGLELPTTALLVAGGLVGVAALLVLVPRVRSRAVRGWRDFAQRGLPRLLDVLGSPRKLAQAIGGILLQTAAFVLCFEACLLALGSSAPVAALAVVFLAGNTVGTAVPTPGGLGAVEAALTAGLTAIGIPAAVAVPGVLLFRLVTFWLPILPGWLAWTRMQKTGAL
ncbi:MAG TPA: lysylphosphatidylglycerol synthase transmembrane domain-containing protein [Jiangellales bacterium]|nr:lysylphosphatidylglycerol synthase transmembrane domain-containing protein [Jiangellales bacterium]